MSDNVNFQSSTLASPPAATVVATDDCAGAQVQIMKLAGASDGDATVIDPATESGQTDILEAIVGVELSVAAIQATSSGDTTLVAAPGSGLGLRLVRIEASNSHASTALVVGLKSTVLNSGAVFGKRYLPAAGGAAVWQWPNERLTCGDDDALVVNLSGAGQIEVTAYYAAVAV